MAKPRHGQGDHRDGASRAGVPDKPTEGFGKEIQGKRQLGHLGPSGTKGEPKRPSLPTYSGGSPANVGSSHPFFGRSRRPGAGVGTTWGLHDREVDRR